MSADGPRHLIVAALVAAGLPAATGAVPAPPDVCAPPAADGDAPAHGSPADTVVDGFHGYDLGTPAGSIGEIEPSGSPDARLDGLEVYARTLRFLGMPTRAYFYLDTAEHRLRRGKHLMEPGASSCARQLNTLRLMVAGTHPELRVQSIRRSGASADTADVEESGLAAARCPDLMGESEAVEWTLLMRNPRTDAVEVRMELFRRGGEPRILACYLNQSDCAWPDSVEVRPGPELRAPGRGPDTASARGEAR